MRRAFATAKKNSPSHQPTTNLWELGSGITPKTLTVSCWNVNGIRSVIRKNTLKQFIYEDLDSDIMCLNQTKMDFKAYVKEKQGIQQALQLGKNGYFQYWNFCKVMAGYSGVSIFSKTKALSMIQDIPFYPQHSMEGRCITLEFEKFYLVNCYKPNSGAQLKRLDYRVEEYDKKFTDFLLSLQAKKPIIVVGDLNVAHQQIDLKYPKSNRNYAGFTYRQRESFTDILNKTQLIDSWRSQNPNKASYTWWSYQKNARENDIGWRIDYVLVDKRIRLINSQIHNKVLGSDHCPVSAKLQIL